MVAGPPSEEPDVPQALRRVAGDGSLRAVWQNELGGITFEVERRESHLSVKWVPADSALDLSTEAARMRWAGGCTPVSRPVDQGADSEGSWLVTEAISGEMVVLDRWKAEPRRAVAAVGEGLRAMHDALPAADCPFSWSAEARLQAARVRAAEAAMDPPT